jgi:hypothetical protein
MARRKSASFAGALLAGVFGVRHPRAWAHAVSSTLSGAYVSFGIVAHEARNGRLEPSYA